MKIETKITVDFSMMIRKKGKLKNVRGFLFASDKLEIAGEQMDRSY